MKKILSLLIVLTLFTSAIFAAGQQGGAGYPARPVTCIVPYAPGGGSDTLVRAVMRSINLPNNQSMVAVNIDGAAGLTGGMRAFNSSSDGYTIMTHNTLDLVTYYLSGRDTIPIINEGTTIALMVNDYNVISTNRIAAAEYGWRTIEDVVAWARANPNTRIRWGASGSMQSDNMISTVRLVRELGIEDNVNFILYEGGTPVRTASMANEVNISMNTASELPGVIASGDNIPLLVIHTQRIPTLPNVPSTMEKGINVTMSKPRGFYGPRGMDPEHVRILENALREVSNDPEFRDSMSQLGFDVNFIDSATARQMANQWIEELRPFFQN